MCKKKKQKKKQKNIRTAGPVSGHNSNKVIVHKFRQASDL